METSYYLPEAPSRLADSLFAYLPITLTNTLNRLSVKYRLGTKLEINVLLQSKVFELITILNIDL